MGRGRFSNTSTQHDKHGFKYNTEHMATTNSTKVTSSHRTVTGASARIVDAASRMPEVTNIGLGKITHVVGGRKDVKFSRINGGIKAAVRGAGAVHEVFIYTDNPEGVQKKLSEAYR